MATGISTDLVLSVQEALRSTFIEKGGRRAISVHQLVEEGLGSEQEVAGALMELRRIGCVTVLADIRCPNGDDVWRGPPEEVRKNLWRKCERCNTRERNLEEEIRFRFTISEGWAKRLMPELEKKSLELGHA